MSPRPRKVSDDELFAATHAVMNRVGPGELTLAAIAREAGVTAAVLVQRFGSKRDLLLTLAEKFADGSGDLLGDLIKRHRSPLAALRAYADCMAGMAASPAALARNLSYLQIDLTDPDFRRHLVKHARATRAGLSGLLSAAVESGELAPGYSRPNWREPSRRSSADRCCRGGSTRKGAPLSGFAPTWRPSWLRICLRRATGGSGPAQRVAGNLQASLRVTCFPKQA